MAAISDVYDDLGRHKTLLLTHPGAAAWLVRTALAANEEERATAVVLTAAQLASDNGSLPATRALATHARGIFDQDAEALRSAAEDAPTAWARASAQEDAGRLEESLGNYSESASLFERAEHEYSRAGAVRDAERVRAHARAA